METYLYSYPKTKVRYHTAVLFPNSYHLGMSNLGFQTVFHLLQGYEDVRVERAFYDAKAKGSTRTVETNSTLDRFNALFISISFEMDLLNIIRMLEDSGIPLRRNEREGKHYPTIIVGGIATTFIGRYLREIADVVISGESGITIPPIMERLLDGILPLEKGVMDGILGVHTAGSLGDENLPYCKASDWNEIPHSVILTEDTSFSNRGLIQVSKSCKYRCAFCLVQNAYGDYDFLPKEALFEVAERYEGKTDRLGLVAATLTNHPEFREIIQGLNDRGFTLSFSAFRIEGLDDELLEMIINNANKTLVIAPETATKHLKHLIHKNIPRELIIDKVRIATALGIKRLKLYFMCGFPGETIEDMQDIVDLVTEIRAVSSEKAKEFGYIPEIIVDVNPLVPKPLTEFANVEMEKVASLRKKIMYVKKKTRGLGRTFFFGESPRSAKIQYEIASGILRLEDLIEMAKKG